MRKLGAGFALRKTGSDKEKGRLGGWDLVCSGFSFPPSSLLFYPSLSLPILPCVILLIEFVTSFKNE